MNRIRVLPSAPATDVIELGRTVGLSTTLAGVLWHRGLRDADAARDWLRPRADALLDPYLFTDMERAVSRIRDAMRRHERILIHGDYDVDGLSGTVILVSILRLLGADVDYHIPDRSDGYSFSKTSIERIEEGRFHVCISVDNGTAAVTEVARIQELGCDVIVTDHHDAGPEVAPAIAMLNPRLEDSGYPFPHLAGCGVAFKLACGLAQSFSPRHVVADDLRKFLVDAASLVALGTVADVVPLRGENRILVRTGLKALVQSPNPGLRALIDNLGAPRSELFADDISYRLGPRLNAAGRMAHASLAVRLLCCQSYGEAQSLAKELEALNRRRQRVESETTQKAMAAITEPCRVILAVGEGWHLGVLGIVAARLAEHFHRPAIVLGKANGRARGSGRSFGSVDLKRLLDAASTKLTRYGGHQAAVGLEIPVEHIESFRQELAAAASDLPAPAPPELEADQRAPLSHWTSAELRSLADFRPFGRGNRPPWFVASGVRIGSGLRRVGPAERGLTFTAIQDGVAVRALAPALGGRIEELIHRPQPWHMVYTPRLAARSDGSPIELLVHGIERNGPA